MDEQIALLRQIDCKLSAVVALLVDEREAAEGVDRKKSELLLADAGLKAAQIASITGKKTGAVRHAIVRARKHNRFFYKKDH